MKNFLFLIAILLISSTANAALTVNNIPKTKTGGTSPALQDSSVTELSGNVGVGSTAPGTKLDVQGTGRFSSTLTASNLSGTNTGDQTSVTGNAGTATALAANGTNCSAGSYPLGVDASGNSESCTIAGSGNPGGSSPQLQYNNGGSFGGVASSGVDSNGNIGIGSVNPVRSLDVEGTGQFHYVELEDFSTSIPVIFPSTDANTGVGFPGPDIIAIDTGGSRAVTINSAQNVGIGTGVVNSKLSVNGGAQIGAGYITNTAPTNGLIVQGNTGIGSSAPGTVLDVQGTTRTTGFQLSTGASSSYVMQTNGVGVGTWVNANTLPTSITLTTTGTSGASTLTNNVLNIPQYSGGSSQWLTISSVGLGTYDNVGIGTISSASRLTVLGNLGIGSLATDAYITTSAPVGGAIIQGNVGIGSTRPGANLDVQGTMRVTNATNKTTILNANLGVGTANPGVALDVNGAIRLSNSGDSYFQGNVGVGTTIPMNTMAIQGSLAVGAVSFTGTANNTNDSTFSGNIGVGTTRTTTAALTVMNGNVGIGTWIPSARLSIKGGALTALQSGANTACTTTCGAFGCYAAFDTASGWVGVDCTDASADSCFCSK